MQKKIQKNNQMHTEYSALRSVVVANYEETVSCHHNHDHHHDYHHHAHSHDHYHSNNHHHHHHHPDLCLSGEGGGGHVIIGNHSQGS